MENADTVKCENGYQLFNRLSIRPSLENLHPQFFSEGAPKGNEMVQIAGSSGSGKSTLIGEILARCILPVKANGKECHAVFINTDHHLNILTITQAMKSLLKLTDIDTSEIKSIIENSLIRLNVLNCFSSEMLKFTFKNLERLLSENLNITLIAIDSLTAYYWYERYITSENLSFDKYIRRLVKELKGIIDDRNVVTIFSVCEFQNFSSNSSYIKYFIDLRHQTEDFYQGMIVNQETNEQKKFNYRIKRLIEIL